MPASVPTLTLVAQGHLLKDSGSGCGPDETSDAAFMPTMMVLQARGLLSHVNGRIASFPPKSFFAPVGPRARHLLAVDLAASRRSKGGKEMF